MSMRLGVYLIAIVCYVAMPAAATPETAPLYPECENYCGPDAYCGDTCAVGVQNTVCGDYDGGYTNGMCNYPSWSSCNYICSRSGDDGTSCTEEGTPTTCGAYGMYLTCGDGVCSDGEDCDSCSNDCGVCPSYDHENEAATIANMLSDMDNAGGLDGTAEAALIAVGVYQDYGYVADEDYMDSGDFDDSWPTGTFACGETRCWAFCTDKSDMIAAAERALKAAKNLKRRLDQAGMILPLSWATSLNDAAIAALTAEIAVYQSWTCIIGPYYV